MKKLLFLFLLFSKTVLFSQTVLNSLPLNLNNLNQSQILNIEDEANKDIYAFAWDNKNINILKYNKFFFLKSQFTDSIKQEKSRNLMGAIITEKKKPTLYWISQNYKNLVVSTYDLEKKTSESLNFIFPESHDYIITSFQQQTTFYILAKEKESDHLLLYKFKDGKCEIKMFDFSNFIFKNERNVAFSFSALIKRFPIRKMEQDILNPIDLASKINKLYVLKDRILLTFDYNTIKTQVFDLNTNTGEVEEKNFNQPLSKTASRNSNSFYYDKKLFQLKANKDEFLFDVKDFDSEKTIKTYSFLKNDTIAFKRSPFFMQIDNNRPQQLKTTAKFLKNLDGLSAGVSVIKNKKNTFITFSGFGEYFDFYYSSNSFDDFGERIPYSLSKMVYFDALLNENMDAAKDGQTEPLAIDNLFYFLNSNKNISLFDALKLKDYYILSYFDSGSKQFIIRRFTDGFMMENNGNPIMNKAQFSRPASFGSISSY